MRLLKLALALLLTVLADVAFSQGEMVRRPRLVRSGSNELLRFDSATTLGGFVPQSILHLVRWSPEDPSRLGTILEEDSGRIPPHGFHARGGINKSISEAWRPTTPTQILYVDNHPVAGDFVRWTWTSHDCRVEFSQSLYVAAVSITPDEGGTGRSPGERLTWVRQLAREVFPNRYRIPPSDIVLEPLAERLSRWITSEGRWGVLEDGIVAGRLASRGELGLPPWPDTVEERRKLGDPASPEFRMREMRWEHWFGTVHWWNDGERVVFFFKKVALGSPLSFTIASRDQQWFEHSYETYLHNRRIMEEYWKEHEEFRPKTQPGDSGTRD